MKMENTLSRMKNIVDNFYGLFMGNLIFLLFNLPILYILFCILPPRSIQPSTLELYLCLLPIGPAYTGLLYSMGKMLHDKDISVIRNYWKSYRHNFKQALSVWALLSLMMILLSVIILNSYSAFYYLQLIAFVILFMMCLYIFPVISRFETTIRQIMVLAFYSIFSQFKLTIFMVMMIVFSAMLLLIIPSMAILLVASILSMLIMIILKDFLKALEKD